MRKSNFRLVLIFFSIFIFSQDDLSGQSDAQTGDQWRTRTRMQLGSEHDSNVNEDTLQAVDARSLKLMIQSSARRNLRKAMVNFDYQMGFQTYWNHAEENKLINELEFTYSQHLIQRIQLGIEGWGRLKAFLNQDEAHDIYGTGTAGLFGNIFLPWQVTAKASAHAIGLNYARTERYDYSGPEWLISFRRSINSDFTVRTDFWHRVIQFKRDIGSQTGTWPITNYTRVRQQDRQNQIGLALEYGKNLIFHVQYWYDFNQSNVDIFDYERQRLILLLGMPVSKSILIRLFTTYEDKKYRKQGRQLQPLELDLERNENNFIIFDVSKSLSEDLAAICRLAWYKNETEIIGKYYDKVLINIALELRF